MRFYSNSDCIILVLLIVFCAFLPNSTLKVLSETYLPSKFQEKSFNNLHETKSGFIKNVTYENYYGVEIAVANDGSIYTVGYSRSNLTGADLTLIKWDSSGNPLWDRSWGETDVEIECNIAIDTNDNIYTVGTIYPSAEGLARLVLVKWDSSGNLLWTQTWYQPGYDSGVPDIAVDSDGNIYTLTTAELCGTVKRDLVLIKWDKSGNLLWDQIWKNDYHGLAITIDKNDNIYTLDLSAGEYSIAKWDIYGTNLWVRPLNNNLTLFGNNLVTDSNGNIYITGNVAFTSNTFLMKWDISGNLIWNQIGNLTRRYEDLFLGSDGNIYLIGMTTLSTNRLTKVQPQNYNLLLEKWDAMGTLIGIKIWDGDHEDYGISVAVGKDDRIYCIGTTGPMAMQQSFVLVIFSPTEFSSVPNFPERTTPVLSCSILIITLCFLAFCVKRTKRERAQF